MTRKSWLPLAIALTLVMIAAPAFAQQFGPARATSDIRAVFRAELRALDADLRNASGRARDDVTRAHLDDARDLIAKILDPK